MAAWLVVMKVAWRVVRWAGKLAASLVERKVAKRVVR